MAAEPTNPGRKSKPAPDEVRAWTELRHALRTYRVLQSTFGPVARGLFAVKRVGIDKIPKTGPAILVTNHASNLDPVVVIASLKRPVFHLAKRELFKTRFGSWFFQTLGGQIPVDRTRGGNEAAVEAAVRALEAGHCLAVYPEGHRSADGRLHRGRPGLGRIALLSGAPCFPVAVDGTWRAWPKGKKVPRPFRRTRVIVGAPRRYATDARLAEDTAACQRITDQLMGDLAAILGQPYDAPAAPPARPD